VRPAMKSSGRYGKQKTKQQYDRAQPLFCYELPASSFVLSSVLGFKHCFSAAVKSPSGCFVNLEYKLYMYASGSLASSH
jgi:hypothetical protein